MSRHALDACVALAGACANASAPLSCVHTDDFFSWFRRRDASPCLTLINAFVGAQLCTIDAGEHVLFAAFLSLVQIMAGTFAYVTLTELSIIASALVGAPGLALRGYWASVEPLATLPLVGAGAFAGVVYAWATRVPPLFSLDPLASRWRNAKHALQSVLVLGASFYFSNAPDGYDGVAQHALRPEWVAYAMTKTLALAIVFVWNRTDEKNRVLVYGADVRAYDGVWARFALVYAVLLALPAYMWARAWVVACTQAGAALALALLLGAARRGPRASAYGALVPMPARAAMK